MICKNCILTENECPNIKFNDKGVCNYCQEFYWKEKQRRIDKTNWPWIVYEIKKQCKGKDYDCLLGLSGGVDSSMCLHYLIEQGLRPLCFSVDNGYQTPEANENIMRLVEGLKVPYYRYNINLEAFRGLQEAFIKAGLKNIEIPTDHILMATTYEMANNYGIKYIISGGNLATEGIMPEHFGYNANDLTHLKGVYKQITGKKLTGLPTISLLKYIYYRFIKGIKIIQPLNYYEYHRENSIKLLSEKYGYKPYGEKHGENIFTKWFQNIYLIQKFGLDKRIPHLSSMINSAQITRREALKEMKNLTWSNFVPKGFDPMVIAKIENHDYKDYPHSEYWWKLLSKIYKKLKC